MSFGLYLHIPYCPARCRYCDFYAVGGSRTVPPAYLSALLRAWAAERCRLKLTHPPATVYFGGGTPGLLTPEQVAEVLRAVAPVPGAEITLETNPELVTPRALEGYLRAGVNRLSLGVQTAFDDSLARLGRRHTAAQARQALRWARQAGFTNLCGDIMLALPQYSRAEFDATLELIGSEGASHISAYLLKIEPDTAFGRRLPPGLPDADEAAEFYLYAVEQLERAGYAQYEISNFSRPGLQGRHNLIYWDCGDYLGLGPAAHSCIGDQRFFWPSDRAAFIQGSLVPQPDGDCGAEDFILLQLRLCRGLSLPLLRQRYGVTLTPAQLTFVHQCCEAGYALLVDDVLRLTPRGMLVQNSILAGLLG